jgi:diaminobutyrate-2-oxoglutarate transaminase
VDTFDRLESRVRSYSRAFPVVFDRAAGPFLYGADGRRYIDLFCGAGALNYGHNEPRIKAALMAYLERDGVTHALDMATSAKGAFLERFEEVVLRPRGLDYRVQFTGPTGANAVEAAIKLARKVTRRSTIVSFTQAYHGLSQGALSLTANAFYRDEAYVVRGNTAFMPYDGYMGPAVDTADYLERCLTDEASGLDRPAAVIVETIQAEGGINVASARWLQQVQAICRRHDVLLIVDDIQTGCGRTGEFFSFEDAGLDPDIVLLSKSISGLGLPMSLVLLKPAIDQWKPGEHTGTFRGNNAAFVTATEALSFWATPELGDHIASARTRLAAGVRRLAQRYPDLEIRMRGRGLINGIETRVPALSRTIVQECFTRGLIVELCGGARNVIKLLPPLNIADDILDEALGILGASIEAACAGEGVGVAALPSRA